MTWEGGDYAIPKDPLRMPEQGRINWGEASLNPYADKPWWSLDEGSYISRGANQIPGMNSLAGYHDVWQVTLRNSGIDNIVSNVVGMPIAGLVSYTALINGVPALSVTAYKSAYEE